MKSVSVVRVFVCVFERVANRIVFVLYWLCQTVYIFKILVVINNSKIIFTF